MPVSPKSAVSRVLICLFLCGGAASFTNAPISALAQESSLPNQTSTTQWTPLPGPSGDRVTAIVATENQLFLSTSSSVYRSANGGQSWQRAGTELPRAPVGSLLVAGNYVFANLFIYGWFHTAADGQSWTALTEKPAGENISFLAANGEVLLATTNTGLWRSTDYGQSWARLSNDPATRNIRSLAFNGNRWLAGTSSQGVLLSLDSGQTWTASNSGLSSLSGDLAILRVGFSGNNLLASVVYSGLFLSTDNGQSWRKVLSNSFLGITAFGALLTRGNEVFVSGETDGVWHSTNNGRDWIKVSAEPFTTLAQQNNRLFGVTFYGVAVSTDNGRTWTRTNQGLITSSVRLLETYHNELFAVTTSGLSHSPDAGETWANRNTGLEGLIYALAVTNTQLFAATSLGVYRSNDRGQTWLASNPLTLPSVTTLLAYEGELFAGSATRGLYRSRDGGQSWSSSQTGLPSTDIYALAAGDQTIYAAVSDQGLFASTNRGANWSPRNNGLTDLNIRQILVSNGKIFVRTTSGLFWSRDRGQSWTRASANIFGASINALAVRGAQLFAVTFGRGVFLSLDDGNTWTAINQGLPNLSVTALAASDDFLFAGVSSEGIFRGTDFIKSSATVSAASYAGPTVAPESIAAVFGTELATSTQAATSLPLPTTLAGTSVRVRDSAGVERLAPLFFVSPTQANFQIPPDTAAGAATTTITNAASVATSSLSIAPTASGIFTANANGQGVPAAVVLRIKTDGTQSYEVLSRFDQTLNQFVAVPVEVGQSGEQVFLLLYGTGVRQRTSLAAISVTVGGLAAPVSFAGAQGELTGLDQINVRLPAELAGRGEVTVSLRIGDAQANPVQLKIK